MDEDFSDSGILDIVRGLQDVDVDTSAPARDEERQGNENVKLDNDF